MPRSAATSPTSCWPRSRSGPRRSCDDALRRLVEAGLLFQRGVPPQATFLFKHTLVRDTAYSTLIRGQRQGLHARVGIALEKDFRGDREDRSPEILAHHFTEAGLADKAVGYWLRAGKNATARSANSKLSDICGGGSSAVDHLPDGAPKDRLELDLQFALGPCLIATGRSDRGRGSANF